MHRVASIRKSATKIKEAPKKRKKKQISEEVALKLQQKLKAACLNDSPQKFFRKFDKDKSGDMDAAELTRMIRVSLKLGKDQLTDNEIKALIDALDDDGSGSLSLEELGDFVERGSKTFYSDAKAGDDGEKVAKWGAKAEEPEELKKLKRAKKKSRKKRPSFNEAVMRRFQMKLQAAVFGASPAEFFAKFDLSDGDIDAFVKAVDDDGTGSLSLAELGDFVEHGATRGGKRARRTKTFFADAATAEALSQATSDDSSVGSRSTVKSLKWGERAEEAEAAKEARKTRLAKKRRPDFDPEVMRKLQGRLQAATFGKEPLEVFKAFDKSGDNVLDLAELTRMIRVELRISGDEIPDDVIAAFVRAVDDDGDATVSLEELADFVQYGMATFYADHAQSAENAPQRARGKSMAWGERAPEAQAAVDARNARRKKRLRPDFDAAVMKKLQMRLKEACRGFDDVREGLKAFDKSGDGQLDGDELKRMIRVDLRITDADLKDSDVAAFLRVVDEDGSGFVSVDELADFVSRLKGRPTRPAFKAVDGDGDGRVPEADFVGALRGDLLNLSEDDLDADDVGFLVKIVVADDGSQVDVRKLAALLKRGAALFPKMAAADRKLVADFTKIYRLRVERATSARVLADFEAKQPKRDPNLDVPKLGKRLAPFHTQLFAWLDDVKASPLKPRTAKNIHDFDQAKGAVGGGSLRHRGHLCGHAIMVKEDLGPSNVQPLRELRYALKYHEDLGSNVAAGATLLKMGRCLRRAPLHRDHPVGPHRALELKCAGEACGAAARCFEKELESGHPTYARAALEAGDALLAAEDEWVRAHGLGVGDDLDDAAEAERVSMLQLAQRVLSNCRAAQAAAAVNVKSMAPRELVEFSKTQCLLAVVFARQKVPSKAEEHFDKSLKLFGRLKLSQRNAVAEDEADWHGHRARAAFRDGDFALAKTHIKEREALLASAVGGDDPRLVETRRVRILWARGVGAGPRESGA
ncbi:hypothetical protein JL721_12794 [Aureococcus anophagefferens]|nr:hypothetical protein JL721_12794 [Aureococcus anophagefferens]